MEEQSVVHNTFVIERSFPKPPQQVFSAFSDADKKRRWFGEGSGHDLQEFTIDFRVGGEERSRYCFKPGTPFGGVVLENEGKYFDIVPDRRIVIASSMSFAGKRISVSLMTLEFLETDKGTDLLCTHQGSFFEGADGPQIREAGWRSLFDKLAAELAV